MASPDLTMGQQVAVFPDLVDVYILPPGIAPSSSTSFNVRDLSNWMLIAPGIALSRKEGRNVKRRFCAVEAVLVTSFACEEDAASTLLREHVVALLGAVVGRAALGAADPCVGVAAGAGLSVLVTGAVGFVGTHCSLVLRKRGRLSSHGVFVVEGDINDGRLLAKLFNVAPFTHVLHLAAQAGVRYTMENPASHVHSNIAGLVSLLKACKDADPQPAIVWASSSSVQHTLVGED
ncbi:hypothetical protein EJB05_31271, partial [Eragrostis curvula]